MPILRHLILIPLVILLFVVDNYGAHIVGGQLVYTCQDTDLTDNEVTYLMECTIYRDLFSTGATFDEDVDFGVFRFNGTSWIHVENVGVEGFEDQATIDFDESNPCVEIPPNVGVEEATYRFLLTLEKIDEPYLIVYQRCCRNSTITNVINPGDQGAAVHVTISPEAQDICNSSPKFLDFPPIFICQDEDLFVSQAASDIDGHTLRYSFCAPLTAGGTDGLTNADAFLATSCTGVTPNPANCPPPYNQIPFAAPFTATAPLGAGISINQNTGLITGVPDMIGQYVVGICVEEFIGNVKIGEIIRDFQFNVVECNPLVDASMVADSLLGPKSYLHILCGETEIDFENTSVREDKIISYDWIMEINGVFDTVTTRDASYAFPGPGSYTGLLLLNKETDCADSAFIRVDVFPETLADYSFDYDTCVAGPITFTDLSTTMSTGIVSYDWNFGEGIDSVASPSFEYPTPGFKDVSLIITDVNGCTSERIQTIRYQPVPETLIAVPSSFVGCAPANVLFDNLSIPIDSTYTIVWDFGDGSFSDEVSPTNLYENEGVYSVRLEVTSPIGCYADRDFPNLITIKAAPEAAFDCSTDELNSLESEIQLFDRSIDAERLQWIIPGVGVSEEEDPIFTLPDTGMYEISLIAIHESGCPDTLKKLVDVVPLNNIFFPNAFTPNNDGKNDDFKAVGFIEGLTEYSMTIWNRWGETIFSTDDFYQGWNGQKNNTGQLSPEGAYVYTYSYTDGRGGEVQGEGKILLLR